MIAKGIITYLVTEKPHNEPLTSDRRSGSGIQTVLPVRPYHKSPRPAGLPRQDTEKQRLLQAVQAAALVQAALVHRGAGLTIHLDETEAAGIRLPVTGFRLPVDRREKPPVVLLLRGRFAGNWPARVSRRRPSAMYHRLSMKRCTMMSLTGHAKRHDSMYGLLLFLNSS